MTISNWTIPTLPSPLELESTNCYKTIPGNLLGIPAETKTLNVGDSCTYTIKYSSAESAGQTTLPFTYNNGITSGQISDVAVDWTSIIHQYMFVVGGTGEGASILRCELNPNDGAIASCNVTPDNATWFTPQYMAFVTINDMDYAYINDGSSLYLCNVTESKNLDNCNTLTVDNIPKDAAYTAMEVTKVNGTSYLYTSITYQLVGNNGSSENNRIYKCPINNDASLGSCEDVGFDTTLYGQQGSALGFTSNMSFININTDKYMYITSALSWTPSSSFPFPG